ncbi:MAG: hypothetical protein ACXAC5_04020 [Promethearchaeota archaeon]|jgi:regulator of replication initiation timing
MSEGTQPEDCNCDGFHTGACQKNDDEIAECQYCGRSKKGPESLCGRCRDQGEITKLREELVHAQKDREIIVSCLEVEIAVLTADVERLKEHQETMSKMATPADYVRDENRILRMEVSRLKERLETARIGREEWKSGFIQLCKEMNSTKVDNNGE